MLLGSLLGSAATLAKESSPDVVERSPEQVLVGTITSGTASWASTTATWTNTGTGPSHNFLIAGQDQVFQDWWWYRLGTDTREFTLPTPTSEAYNGDTATLSWTNFNGTGLNATLRVVVADNPARVNHVLVVTNPTAAAVTFNAFRYVDFDLNATAGSDSATLTASPGYITVTDGARVMPLTAAGAANFAVSSFSTVRGLLSNVAVDNFANTGLPFGPGDFTGGFQWAPVSIPAGGSASFESQYGGESVYGITGSVDGASLVRFASNSPGTVTTVGAITGVLAGHFVRAIDFRPATGQLYALSVNGTAYQLYTVNLTTAVLTPVGAPGTVGTAFPNRVSMDFNPTVDRLRVITGSNASYRINPNDGTLAGTDTNTAYAAGDPNAGQPPLPAGVAYDRNDTNPATPTTLFLYDFNNDALSRVGGIDGAPSPNGGQLTTIFEPASFVTNDAGLGMDISSAGSAFISYNQFIPGQERGVLGGTAEVFSLMSMTTGAITVIGPVQAGIDLLDISIVPAGVASADLSIALTDTPDPVNAGSNLSYTATVTNLGPGDAADVSASLPLPATLTFVSSTVSAGGTCTTPAVGANGTVTCTWAGATASGGTRSFTVVALVPTNTAAGTVISATATTTSPTVDPVAANNTASTTTSTSVSADVSITLTDAPDPVTAGTSLTYTATVTNAGPSDATGVSVSLPTPTGTSFVSGSVTGGSGGTCAAGISCTITGSMTPGSTRTITITVLVAPSVLSGTVITATATVTATSPDPNAANNTATTTTSVIASADLQIGFTSSHTQVLINVPVTFTATSLNNGPSDAQNVSITVTLTPDFRYSSHTATGATCTTPQIGNTGAIVCTWAGPTAPGVTRTLTVVAFSNVEGNTAVNASTTSNTPDPNTGNNQASLSVVVGYPFEEIPTLSGYALALLGLLLGLVGFVAVRRQS